MEITQETLDKIINNWNNFKTSLDKMDALINDIVNCKSDYTKSVLVSAISKLSETNGLKEKIFG